MIFFQLFLISVTVTVNCKNTVLPAVNNLTLIMHEFAPMGMSVLHLLVLFARALSQRASYLISIVLDMYYRTFARKLRLITTTQTTVTVLVYAGLQSDVTMPKNC